MELIMNNKIGLGIIVLLVINLVVLIGGFGYSKQETNPQPKQTPIQSLNPRIQSTPQPTSQSTLQQISNKTITYEWNLKPEFMNNVTWLSDTMYDSARLFYSSNITWAENYYGYLRQFWVFPKALADSNIGALVKAAFISYMPLNATYDEKTGLTKASYPYNDAVGYAIEGYMPYLSDGRGWTKNIT
jgi:hypothetical protein